VRPTAADRTCAHHEGAPGIAVCADCGADICGACHGADARGFAVCPPCRGDSPSSVPAWESRDRRYRPGAYAETLWKLIRYPRTFFRDVAPDGAWVPPVVFGCVSALIGVLGGRIGKLAVGSSFTERLAEYEAAQSIPQSELQWLVLLSAPISAALAVGAHIAILRVASRVGGAEMDWIAATRVGGYALGVFVFLLIPPVYGFEVGGLLAVFWLFNLEASALRHLFGLSAWRATFIVLLPVLVALLCAG